jgi:calcineurin-like phosphoesterase family protein
MVDDATRERVKRSGPSLSELVEKFKDYDGPEVLGGWPPLPRGRASKVHFASDLHFWHNKAAHFRKFGDTPADVIRMNEAIIENWNAHVSMLDRVYLLGDVSFAGAKKTIEVVTCLKGRITLIRGNHDKGLTDHVESYFDEVYDIHTAKIAENQADGTAEVQRIVLCHFPMLVWDRCHHGAWHLHGHSHGTCKYPNPDLKIMDVGVDALQIPQGEVIQTVISYDQAKSVMSTRVSGSQDYHNERTK